MTFETSSKNVGMAFFGDEYSQAVDLTRKFIGDQGRIATLPDIIDARLTTQLGQAPWEQYFCTNSSEYFGYSKQGNPIIVVAHGNGPLSTPEGILAAYNSPLKRDIHGRIEPGGRVSHRALDDLVEGKYGDVSIVDFTSNARRYEYPFLEQLTAWQAVEDPLVNARLGARTEEYVLRHHDETIVWAAEINKAIEAGEVEHFGIKRERQIGSDRYKLLQVSDPNNNTYRHFAPDGYPLAHTLSINQLMALNGNSLFSEVSCNEGLNPARLVGVRCDGRLENIVPSVHLDHNVLEENRDRLLKSANPDRIVPDVFKLSNVGEEWFTQYSKGEGFAMDTGELEYQVTDIEEVAGPNAFWTKWGGYYGFFKYDIEEVKALMPEGANAYDFTGEVTIESGNHVIPIKFYRVSVDTSHYFPCLEEISSDYETLMWLAPNRHS